MSHWSSTQHEYGATSQQPKHKGEELIIRTSAQIQNNKQPVWWPTYSSAWASKTKLDGMQH